MQQIQDANNIQNFSAIEISGGISTRIIMDDLVKTFLNGGMRMPKSQSENYTHNNTFWQGGSGRHYPVTEQSVSDFLLSDTNLYMLVANNRAVWVGTSDDLIRDSASRAQFRSAVSYASAAFEMALPTDDTARVCLSADLLNGQPASKLHAA